jgi:hypothetical protein
LTGKIADWAWLQRIALALGDPALVNHQVRAAWAKGC